MVLKKIVAPSLTDLFVTELKRLILSGELKAGEKLPPERQLAEQSGVSLAVINAGINKLQMQGFINVVPRQGIFVADYVRDGNINTMMEVIAFTGDVLSKDVLMPVIVFRRGIEVAATKRACDKRTEDDLVRIKEILDEIVNKDNFPRFPELAFEFVHEVAVASTNIYYPMLIRTFESAYTLYYKNLVSVEELDRESESFRSVYDALCRRDAEAAEKIINDCIDIWEVKMGFRK